MECYDNLYAFQSKKKYLKKLNDDENEMNGKGVGQEESMPKFYRLQDLLFSL